MNLEKKPKPNLPEIKSYDEDITLLLEYCAAATTIGYGLECPAFRRRLDAIPNATSGVKMIYGRLVQMVVDLKATLPESKRKMVARHANNMKYRLYFGRPAVFDDRDTILATADLNVLCKAAKANCDICFDKNCNSCPLGKTLDRVMPYSREKHERWSTWEGWVRLK